MTKTKDYYSLWANNLKSQFETKIRKQNKKEIETAIRTTIPFTGAFEKDDYEEIIRENIEKMLRQPSTEIEITLKVRQQLESVKWDIKENVIEWLGKLPQNNRQVKADIMEDIENHKLKMTAINTLLETL